MKNLTGKVAFITGGASGIGLGIAKSLSAAGMKVAIVDIEQDALDRAVVEFAKTNAHVNAEVISLQVDVTNRDAMERAAQDTEAAFGKVHVVCNNAGVAVNGPVDVMSYNDWDWVMGVNLTGVINGVQTFVNRIKAHGEGGHFVNTASMAGVMALPGGTIYTATKFAVVGMSEVMRADLAPHNIGVSVLCPGVVTTEVRNSSRNRPWHLLDSTKARRQVLQGHLPENVMLDVLDSAVVGDMVLAAIQADDPYIFTHPDLRPMVDARTAAIDDSFARWSAYRQDLGV